MMAEARTSNLILIRFCLAGGLGRWAKKATVYLVRHLRHRRRRMLTAEAAYEISSGYMLFVCTWHIAHTFNLKQYGNTTLKLPLSRTVAKAKWENNLI